FLGAMSGATLSSHIAAADVFVFPSLTDTFGVVQLEALACGVPVAAYPVTGPRDVIGGHPVGVPDEDLRLACLGALSVSRSACRELALSRSGSEAAAQFLGNCRPMRHPSPAPLERGGRATRGRGEVVPGGL